MIDLQRCAACGTSVIPTVEGQCPSCRNSFTAGTVEAASTQLPRPKKGASFQILMVLLYLFGLVGLPVLLLFGGGRLGSYVHKLSVEAPSPDPTAALDSDDDKVREVNYRYLESEKNYATAGALGVYGFSILVFFLWWNSLNFSSLKGRDPAFATDLAIRSWFMRWGLPLMIASVILGYGGASLVTGSALNGHVPVLIACALLAMIGFARR